MKWWEFKKKTTDKPIGSGVFAFFVGTFLLVVSAALLWFQGSLPRIHPNVLLGIWFLIAGLLIAYWGWDRIGSTSKRGDYKIGQPTIGLVATVASVSIALIALLNNVDP